MIAGQEESDERLANLLEQARKIAVVGVKDEPNRDAYRIPLYLQRAGYRILPVNPKLDRVLDEECHASLTDLSEAVDIVNLWRASEYVPAHVDEILALGQKPRGVWMQLGIHHGEAAQRLREAGIEAIQDRCIMVEHRRLLAASD